MALTKENGYYALRLTVGGKRIRVRLGTDKQRTAETIERHVEHLQAALAGVALPKGTIDWLGKIDDQLHDRLARTGLVAARVALTLGEYLDQHLERRALGAKPASKIAWGQAARDLRTCLGDDRPLRSITSADAHGFRDWMLGRARLVKDADGKSELSRTTVHKRTQHCRGFFTVAVRQNLLPNNPFAEVRTTPGNPRDRQRYVTTDEIKAVIEAAPSAHWRLLIGLARYAGLRVPSEPLSMRWADLDLAAGRMIVRSPKTEHHGGQAQRIVPVFPELRPLVAECDELAADGDVFVFPESWRLRAQGPRGWAGCNLRTTLEKIIVRAGLAPWPRLWNNLRSSAATDLIGKWPLVDVTRWLGHDAAIAAKHYWQARPEVLAAAAGLTPDARQRPDRNPDQQAHQTGRDGWQGSEHVRRNEKTYGESVQHSSKSMETKGIEPSTPGLQSRSGSNATADTATGCGMTHSADAPLDAPAPQEIRRTGSPQATISKVSQAAALDLENITNTLRALLTLLPEADRQRLLTEPQ